MCTNPISKGDLMFQRSWIPVGLLMAVWFGGLPISTSGQGSGTSASQAAWQRHTIDDRSRGADGTRLADANGDGLPDIVTGWEQGGVTRLYVHPGSTDVKRPWPAVTVGPAANVEDAVMVDLDRDGSIDVVSSCEGNRQAILVHWGPTRERLMDANAWRTDAIPASEKRFRWMFALPVDVDGDSRVDLVAGGKDAGAELGWWKAPEKNTRDLSAWTWHPLLPIGWLMSLEAVDVDGDGDRDLLFTDRKGDTTGCFWLEHPGNDAREVTKPWSKHAVGVTGREAMFLDRGDVDGDGLEDVAIAVRPRAIVICRRLDSSGKSWAEHEIAIPESYGTSKAPAVADLDRDGRPEIVFSTEHANGERLGVGRLVNDADPFANAWTAEPISGPEGVKHDLVETIDLDADGDLDVLTCEETANLGVIWFENEL